MGRFVILSALLLGLIGAVNGQTLGFERRREYAEIGCSPGARCNDCPAKMECFKDARFEKGGRCDCKSPSLLLRLFISLLCLAALLCLFDSSLNNNFSCLFSPSTLQGNQLWFDYPGKLSFDDQEFDEGFTADDCKGHTLSRFIAGTFFTGMFFVLCGFIYTDVVVIRELIRVKALKWNATAYSLFFLLWASLGMWCVTLIYGLNIMGADRYDYWYNSRTPLFTYCLIPFSVIIDFEIGVTWIDLYDRTNKMSKSSSRALKVLKWFLRTAAFIMSFGFLIWVSTGNLLSILYSALMPSVLGFVMIIIAGNLIIKTLCGDKKDVANPNWKVAESIRRAVKHGAGAKVMEVIGLLGMGSTARHPQLGYVYPWFNCLFYFAYTFR